MEEFSNVLRMLESVPKRGMEFGTERTRGLLDELGSPDKKLKIIHIAGTNGKGSVAQYMTRVLISAKKKVGTFTSPAVFNYFEQFCIDGEPIDRQLFVRVFGEVLNHAVGATKFEVETVGALCAFALAGCEYAVLECGLGGEYDATNAVLNKELALITSISCEHTAILGNTLESICKHKSGIIKDCPTVISALNPPEVLAYFKKFGAKVAGKFENPPLNGEAQKYNAGLAAEGARVLGVDETAIYSGVNAAKICGRLEVLQKNGNTYILDGAHNPAAVKELASFIKSEYGCADCAVWGSLSDKDIKTNMLAMSGAVKKVYAVKPESERAMDACEIVKACNVAKITVEADTVISALEKSKGIIVVGGTFTILKEAKQWIEKRQ